MQVRQTEGQQPSSPSVAPSLPLTRFNVCPEHRGPYPTPQNPGSRSSALQNLQQSCELRLRKGDVLWRGPDDFVIRLNASLGLVGSVAIQCLWCSSWEERLFKCFQIKAAASWHEQLATAALKGLSRCGCRPGGSSWPWPGPEKNEVCSGCRMPLSRQVGGGASVLLARCSLAELRVLLALKSAH